MQYVAECPDYTYKNGTFADFIPNLWGFKDICVSDPCSDKTYLNLDGTCCEDETHSVVFVLDESGSIYPNDFAKCVEFVRGITEALNSNLLNSNTKIALVGFSGSGYEYSKLTKDWATFETSLDSIDQHQSTTNSIAGLDLATAYLMGTETNGFDSSRPFDRCVNDMTITDDSTTPKNCNWYSDNNWNCGNFDKTTSPAFTADEDCCACNGVGPYLAPDDASKKFIVYMSDGISNNP
jgi:hypothetical protein